ncbi:IS1182 family transposase [Kitasatospora sp. GP82]|uniref:IS1182 family transposase n=1 Tax=Kitasatospora sp. GP82 TaxID=3035089 RepID=UPI002475B94B|nr:IS1182 family transposase [Kitasatospora sp. GP82]MDH6130598.1 transposase [Kitasatospora sp. GP82]
MSVQPQPWPQPDPQIAAAIRAMYRGKREAPLAVQVRDRLGELFPDAAFADAFGRAGKPGWSPGRLALVTVLQKAAHLTDRQAADEARENLAWKYALGLSLEDPGFDHSVLSEFRSRVVTHGLEERALDLLLERLRELGLVDAGGSQRTDSTHIVAAVRDLNRLELAGESVRAALNALAAACPDWVEQVLVVEDWSRRYADRIDTWRLPTSKAKQDALALDYAKDGYTLLHAMYAHGSPAWLRELPAVQSLRIVLVQNYTRTMAGSGHIHVKRRERAEDGGDGLPPGPIRLASPYDTDTRWSAKRETFWNGYKLHVSETCHPQADGDRPARPNIITNVATTASTLPDTKALEPIHQMLQRRRLLPARHYLDSGYPSAELIVGSAKTYGVALITPVLLDTSRQAKAQEGFAAHDFAVDWDNQQAVCPAGKTSTTWNNVVQEDVTKTVVSFAALDCIPCPFKDRCTSARSNRRQLSLHPRELTEAIRDARNRQQTGTWQRDYALRAGVEGTVRQATHTTGLRRARYRGLAKTHLDHTTSATALNLIRLHSWWNGRPLDRANQSHLARLQLSLAA